MLSTTLQIGVCVAALALAGCGHSPTRPIVDGYTLHGIVRDAQSGALLPGVQVLLGREGGSEMRVFAVTDEAGRFEFKPAPNTAPSTELFRCEKSGYAPLDVLARTSTRIHAYEYLLVIRLEPLTM